MNGSDPSGMMCLDALDPFSSGFSQCWSSGYSKAYHHTVGICIQAGGGIGAYGSVGGCVLMVNHHLTFSATVGAGASSPTGTVMAGVMYSNATSASQLRGPFSFSGGSAGLGLCAGAEGSLGQDPNGHNIYTMFFGGGVGFDAPIPIPVGGQAGESYTWAWTPFR